MEKSGSTKQLASKLLSWFETEGRELPWRNTTDAYLILVSEIMLQQTQVARVITFYERWLTAFPDWKTLAAASNAEVIQLWSGLGYNRRALSLRDIAVQVIEKGVPTNREEWLELKGIGPYTSAALSVFSLHHRHIPIDTNIRRVLGRVLLGIHFPQLDDDQAILEASTSLLAIKKDFHQIPQALFDLATATCTKTPNCAACPLVNECRAAKDFLAGKVETPKRTIKKSRERIQDGKKHPDRIYRGRLLKCVGNNEGATLNQLTQAINEPINTKSDKEWLLALLSRLEKDKMIEKKNKKWFLHR